MSINSIIEFLKENNDIDDIKKILFKYNSEDYLNYVQFTPHTYNRIVLHSCDEFDVILICWDTRQESHIHDHPSKCCLLKVLSGILQEDNYVRELNNNIKHIGKNLLSTRSIGFQRGDSYLHKIKCLQRSVSLHIYIPGKYSANYYSS